MKRTGKGFRAYGKNILAIVPPEAVACSLPAAGSIIALPAAHWMLDWNFSALSITGAVAAIAIGSIAGVPPVYRSLTSLEP